jgi:hypothetical protein
LKSIVRKIEQKSRKSQKSGQFALKSQTPRNSQNRMKIVKMKIVRMKTMKKVVAIKAKMKNLMIIPIIKME